MPMLAAVIRKELLERLVSFRFFVATALCLLLLPGVVYVRAQQYATQQQTYPKTAEGYRRHIGSYQREFNWSHFKHPVARPLNPLSILVEPADLRDGGEVELYWLEPPNFLRADESNPVPRLFPAFNVLTFVTVVMSLLAVVFSFDAVCGEKEQGTLKLMLANALPRSTLLIGKWLGGMAALLLPFVVGVVVSALVMLGTLSGLLARAHWAEMGLIFLLSVLFLSVTYAAGMLVSSLTKRSATSAVILLLVWSVTFLLHPNLVPVVTSWISPMPSWREFSEDMRASRRAVYDSTRERNTEDEWNERAKVPANRPQVYLEKRQLYLDQQHLINTSFEALHERYARRLDAQVEIADNILRVTPLGSYALAVYELAGAGPAERDRFLTAVSRYHSDFFNYFATRSVSFMEKWKASGEVELPDYTVGDFPLFRYQESGSAERVSRSLFDVVLLAAWNVLLFVGAYASFLRSDVS